MDIDRTHLENADEAWITKYRTALSNTPIQQPRFMRVRLALASAHKILVSRLDRILSGWNKTQPPPRPAPAPEPAPVAGPETAIRKANQVESKVKRPSKQGTAATKRTRPIRPANRYRAG
jgi:hypothetical protein